MSKDTSLGSESTTVAYSTPAYYHATSPTEKTPFVPLDSMGTDGTPPRSNSNAEEWERFAFPPGCKDIAFTLLFILNCVALVALVAAGFIATPLDPTVYNTNSSFDIPTSRVVTVSDGSEPALTSVVSVFVSVAILVSLALGTTLLFNAIYLLLLRAFPYAMVIAGIVGNVMFFVGIGTAAVLLSHNYYLAIPFGVFPIFFILYFIIARRRILFAIELIKHSIDITFASYGSYVVSYIGAIVHALYIGLLIASIGSIFRMNFPQGATIALYVYVSFSFYWGAEVIKNVVHVTVSGVAATHYFLSNNLPSNPTLGALRRSMTTSFGSIALGSLIVAIIKTMRLIARMLANNRSNNAIVRIIGLIMMCWLSLMEGLVRMFNHYAFCYVAIYGHSFCESAKATWNLILRSGCEVIANDNITGMALWMGPLFVGFLSAVSCGAYQWLWVGLSDSGYDFVGPAIGFFLGVLLSVSVVQTIDSAICCSIVCWSEDREILRAQNPELFRKLVETYELGW